MEQGHLSSFGQAGRSGLTRDEIVRRLAEGPRRHDRSDVATAHSLANSADERPGLIQPDRPLTPAAVLVPLVRRDTGLTVLLTQRTAHLANHAGQISFPGGRMETEDRDATAAALRETEEEIGLDRGHVDVVGFLDPYVTITGFSVTPVVGLVSPPFDLALDSFEVAEAFEVPLSFFLDRTNHQRHFRTTPQGQKRYYWAMPYQERYIWGATAGMLVNLAEVLNP
ncbi:MAG TPA: CoA pyrophosphatase [Candidatus Sulfotelmatobacter sp.]|jgi:8-oxo-dGTP pyrophosphatase MutT (NUDIX family)|nr:CoA pyrophosphatase [Candidatus Sulfotelmatobacter sp.]